MGWDKTLGEVKPKGPPKPTKVMAGIEAAIKVGTPKATTIK